MRFSLLTFMTVVSFTAWLMCVIKTHGEYRVAVIAFGIMGVIAVTVVLAILSPTRDDGRLDLEKNESFKVMEPAFKLATGIFFVGIALGLIAIAILGVYYVVQ